MRRRVIAVFAVASGHASNRASGSAAPWQLGDMSVWLVVASGWLITSLVLRQDC